MANVIIKRGDSRILYCDVMLSGDPLDLTLYTAWFTAKYSAADADSAAVIRKGNSGVLTGITYVSAPYTTVPNRIRIAINPLDTSGLPAKLLALVYDVQIKPPSGEIYTVADGELQIKPDVTNSTV